MRKLLDVPSAYTKGFMIEVALALRLRICLLWKAFTKIYDYDVRLCRLRVGERRKIYDN